MCFFLFNKLSLKGGFWKRTGRIQTRYQITTYCITQKCVNNERFVWYFNLDWHKLTLILHTIISDFQVRAAIIYQAPLSLICMWSPLPRLSSVFSHTAPTFFPLVYHYKTWWKGFYCVESFRIRGFYYKITKAWPEFFWNLQRFFNINSVNWK